MLSNEEKKEMLTLSQSLQLRYDMKLVSQNKHAPLISNNGITNLDLYVAFLTEYNAMFKHDLKPRNAMLDNIMLL